MSLTDTAIRKAKPGPKPRKLHDERGLFLYIHPNGGRWWRFRYRFQGREKLLSLGTYPDTPLAAARDKRDDARKLVAAGIDPSEQRRAEREARLATFEAIAEEWYSEQAKAWVPSHAETVRYRLDEYLLPKLGKRVFRDITAPDVLRVLKKIEEKGTLETARRVRQIYGQIARYAVASSRADSDVSRDLIDALAPVEVENRAAITDPAKFGGLLRAIDEYDGTLTVKSALKLAALTFVRPGELRGMEWSEINFMKAQWEIPARRMKMKEPLIVPLSTQSLAILRALYRVTGHGRFAFPSPRTGERCMSDNAILSALRRMGVPKEEMSGHGFRAAARTLLDEVLGVRVDLIEAQLAHAVKDPNGRAYHRATYLKDRRKMMQDWGDYLDRLKSEKPNEAEHAG